MATPPTRSASPRCASAHREVVAGRFSRVNARSICDQLHDNRFAANRVFKCCREGRCLERRGGRHLMMRNWMSRVGLGCCARCRSSRYRRNSHGCCQWASYHATDSARPVFHAFYGVTPMASALGSATARLTGSARAQACSRMRRRNAARPATGRQDHCEAPAPPHTPHRHSRPER